MRCKHSIDLLTRPRTRTTPRSQRSHRGENLSFIQKERKRERERIRFCSCCPVYLSTLENRVGSTYTESVRLISYVTRYGNGPRNCVGILGERIQTYENIRRTWGVSSKPGLRTQRYVQKEKAINQIQSGLINWALSIFLEERREGRGKRLERGRNLFPLRLRCCKSLSLCLANVCRGRYSRVRDHHHRAAKVKLWGKENKEQNRCPKTMMVCKIVKRRSKKKIYSRYRIKATICHR